MTLTHEEKLAIRRAREGKKRDRRRYQKYSEGIEGNRVSGNTSEINDACNRFFEKRGIDPLKFNHFDKE